MSRSSFSLREHQRACSWLASIQGSTSLHATLAICIFGTQIGLCVASADQQNGNDIDFSNEWLCASLQVMIQAATSSTTSWHKSVSRASPMIGDVEFCLIPSNELRRLVRRRHSDVSKLPTCRQVIHRRVRQPSRRHAYLFDPSCAATHVKRNRASVQEELGASCGQVWSCPAHCLTSASLVRRPLLDDGMQCRGTPSLGSTTDDSPSKRSTDVTSTSKSGCFRGRYPLLYACWTCKVICCKLAALVVSKN